ncbi:serine hydrolase domain-containing protein [Streptomyces sp. NPDC051310]|uniref:serine hydrolase domain-containing protein n=1 Tax=Streptomyces sp. NPDC051310 TaxID=3365649 RepID=UPI0037BBCE36
MRRAVVLVPVLLGAGVQAFSGAPAPPPPSPLLSRLVSEGHAPGAALLAGSAYSAKSPDSGGAGDFADSTEAADSPVATDSPGPTDSADPTQSAGSTRFESAGAGIRRADRFRAGSVTKTFIAAVVLQLDAERRLRLDDAVSKHLPGLPAGPSGRQVTLRALLSHTSGLPDYTSSAGPAPTTAAEAVRLALATRPPRPPGSYAYANTNYALLGMVIERVTGRSYATEAWHRIIAPLGLTGTSFPGARTTLPDPHGRAYDARGRDVTAFDPRGAGAAGELISTLDDLNRFYAALLGGRLLPPPQLRALLDTRPAHGAYGLGIYPRTLSCGTTVWGHNGHIPGSYVRTATTVDGRRTLTFRVNTDTLAAGTLSALEPALLEAEFCTAPARPRAGR